MFSLDAGEANRVLSLLDLDLLHVAKLIKEAEAQPVGHNQTICTIVTTYDEGLAKRNRDKRMVQDILVDLWLREGSIANESESISQKLTQLTSRSKVEKFFSRLPLPYLSAYDVPIIGRLIIVNPSHNDVCAQFRRRVNKCTDPKCLKIHRKIGSSLISQLSRLETFDTHIESNEWGYIIRAYNWNPKPCQIDHKVAQTE